MSTFNDSVFPWRSRGDPVRSAWVAQWGARAAHPDVLLLLKFIAIYIPSLTRIPLRGGASSESPNALKVEAGNENRVFSLYYCPTFVCLFPQSLRSNGLSRDMDIALFSFRPFPPQKWPSYRIILNYFRGKMYSFFCDYVIVSEEAGHNIPTNHNAGQLGRKAATTKYIF